MLWTSSDRHQAYSPRSSTSSTTIFAVVFTIILAAYFLVFPLSSKMSSRNGPAFTLLVTLRFASPEHVNTFLQDIRPVCEYVKKSEPTTIAYEVLKSDQDPLLVTIMERYVDKDDAYLKIHKSSEPFLEFRPKLKAMQDAGLVSVDGHSYLDSMIGFGDRVP